MHSDVPAHSSAQAPRRVASSWGTGGARTDAACWATADGRCVFVGSSSSKIFRFETLSGAPLEPLSGHQWEVWQVAQAPGGMVASGSYDHLIKLWDAQSGELRTTLKGHNGVIHSLASSGGYLFSGSGDKTLRLWK